MSEKTRQSQQLNDIEVLASDQIYTITEVCTICQLDESGLQECLDYGVIVTESRGTLHFRQPQVDCLLRARRLQQDLELNYAGVALALDLLDTIESLKKDLALLRR